MHFTENPRKSSETNLLPFPSPLVQAGDPAAVPMPHDIAILRRPVPVEAQGPSRMEKMEEIEGLAHDARNLLTSLELFCGLLDAPGVLASEHQHFAGDLKSLTVPLTQLVERMVAVARPLGEPSSASSAGTSTDAGPLPVFVREPLRPALRSNASALAHPWGDQQASERDGAVMVKSCERLLSSIAGPQVALQISCERGLGELALSGESLTRVLINLVKNASEAMPSGGRVSVTLRKGLGARPSALLTVQDTGLGIPAHALGQVFQAGFSSKKAGQRWPALKHHGLGLTIVRDLVEGAGGSVRVASTLKKGTTFEIKLPCRRG